MIDKNVFAEGMGQLGGAFGREIDGPVSRMYYGILSQKLTTAQFTKVVTDTIASERFWPSPAVLLEKAGATDEVLAQNAFRMVHDALNQHSGYRYLPAAISQSWDAPTWAGIKAIGGLREITECTDTQWTGLVKRFCKAYQEALNPTKQIEDTPQPQTLKLVRSVTGAMDRALPAGDR